LWVTVIFSINNWAVVWMVTVQQAKRKGFKKDEALLFIKAASFCCFLYGKMNFLYLGLWTLIIFIFCCFGSDVSEGRKFLMFWLTQNQNSSMVQSVWLQCSSYFLVIPYVVENCVKKK